MAETDRGPHEHDVCLSFAARDREYVHRVAKELRRLGVRCFYDDDFRVELWGKELCAYLYETYRSRALCCVVFGSAAYVEARWPRHELRSAQVRASEQDQEYILLARFDRTEIPGIPSTRGFVDLSSTSPKRLARLINAKVADLRRAAPQAARRDPVAPARGGHGGIALVAGLALALVVAWVLAWESPPFAALRSDTPSVPSHLVDRSPIAESSWTIGMTTLDDTSYSRALVASACEDDGAIFVSYPIDGAYSRFRAVAGIPDDAPAGDALVHFAVRGDGAELHSEPLLAGDTLVVDVPVTGVQMLELVVIYDETDWGNCDDVHFAAWAEARLE